MENHDHWLLLKELFEEARLCDPTDRGGVLERISCDHPGLYNEIVELLTAHDRSAAFLEKPAYRPSWRPGAQNEEVIAVIGPYTLTKVIGTGGMSVVYKASQENTHRIVALKMMRTSLTGSDREWVARRFEAESRILARLRHNNIAQVFEASAFQEAGESIPYFVMEYIPEAKTLLDYCAYKRLSLKKRLLLFGQVCDAIHHGHSNGIIHRDIKPGNLLVDSDGQTKVIDFGVARLIYNDTITKNTPTRTGLILGTLRYMSPEQLESAGRNLDTRSDIYSLGVVLYELLCHRLPYDLDGLNPCQVADAIRHVRPAPPGEIDRNLKGDLTTILLKALDKDRSRRFESVAALRADIDRYLHHQPIQARPPSTIYQVRKLIARHKVSSILTLTVIILLVALSVTMTIQAAQLRKQRNAAEAAKVKAKKAEDTATREAEMAWTAHEVLLSLLSAANPVFPQKFTELGLPAIAKKDLTIRELMDTHGERVVDRFKDNPVIQSSLLHVIGFAYLCNGENEKGLDAMDRAVRLMRSVFPVDHEKKLTAEALLCTALLVMNRFDEAELLAVHCLEVIKSSDKDLETMRPPFIDTKAGAALKRDRLEEALNYYLQSLEIRERTLGPDHEETGASILMAAIINNKLGRVESAEEGLRRNIEIFSKAYGSDHPTLSVTYRYLGGLLHQGMRTQEALEAYQRALEIQREGLPEGHPHIYITLSELGNLLMVMGGPDQAAAYIEESVDGCIKTLGEDSLQTAECLLVLGKLRIFQRRPADAEKISRRVLSLAEAHPVWPKSIKYIAMSDLIMELAMQKKNFEETEQFFEQAKEYFNGYDLFQERIHLFCNMAVNYSAHAQFTEAEKVFMEIVNLEMGRSKGVVSQLFASNLFQVLAHLVFHPGFRDRFKGQEHAEALVAALYDFGMKNNREKGTWIFIYGFKMLMGQILLERGKLAEAERCLRDTDELFIKVQGTERGQSIIVRSLLGACLSAQKKQDEAESLLLKSYDMILKYMGPDHPETKNARERVRVFYETWNEPERAKEYENHN